MGFFFSINTSCTYVPQLKIRSIRGFGSLYLLVAVVEPTCGLTLTGASKAVCVCKGKKEKVTGAALIILILYENKVQCFNGFVG